MDSHEFGNELFYMPQSTLILSHYLTHLPIFTYLFLDEEALIHSVEYGQLCHFVGCL